MGVIGALSLDKREEPSKPPERSLGPGSALVEKEKKSAWADKKIGERSEQRGSLGRGNGGPFHFLSHHSARFARRYFSHLTPFFAFT